MLVDILSKGSVYPDLQFEKFGNLYFASNAATYRVYPLADRPGGHFVELVCLRPFMAMDPFVPAGGKRTAIDAQLLRQPPCVSKVSQDGRS
jgi:hypothetical protein